MTIITEFVERKELKKVCQRNNSLKRGYLLVTSSGDTPAVPWHLLQGSARGFWFLSRGFFFFRHTKTWVVKYRVFEGFLCLFTFSFRRSFFFVAPSLLGSTLGNIFIVVRTGMPTLSQFKTRKKSIKIGVCLVNRNRNSYTRNIRQDEQHTSWVTWYQDLRTRGCSHKCGIGPQWCGIGRLPAVGRRRQNRVCVSS